MTQAVCDFFGALEMLGALAPAGRGLIPEGPEPGTVL